MAGGIKLEFIVPTHFADSQQRADKLIETVVDQVLPKMAASMSLPEDEVFARLLIELGHIIGITHSADSALAMMGMMTDAIMQGQQAAIETASLEKTGLEPTAATSDQTGETNPEALPDWAAQCSPSRH